MDVLLYLIFGGFMCISSGFCTYGCYRCFTDRDNTKVGSECSSTSIRSRRNSTPQGCYDTSKCTRSRKHSGSSSSSFNGTIYTISSDGSCSKSKQQKMLNNSHDYALSINPELIRWTINQIKHDRKEWTNSRRTKTAPI